MSNTQTSVNNVSVENGKCYLKICNTIGEEGNFIKLPLENNKILLSTLKTFFPDAHSLFYIDCSQDTNSSLKFIPVKLFDGAFHFNKDLDVGSTDKSGAKIYTNFLDYIYYCSDEESSINQCTDIIVLGMAWKTDENSMREYFTNKYGELSMVQLKRNPITGFSKGFGFIRFVDYKNQIKCLIDQHIIDGRCCEVKIPESKIFSDKQEVNKKIYVGGVTENITKDDLMEFFSRFGEVSDIFIPKPFRNFAFITFSESSVAAHLLGKQLTYHLAENSANSITQVIENEADIINNNNCLSVSKKKIFLNVQAAAPKLPIGCGAGNSVNSHFNNRMRNSAPGYGNVNFTNPSRPVRGAMPYNYFSTNQSSQSPQSCFDQSLSPYGVPYNPYSTHPNAQQYDLYNINGFNPNDPQNASITLAALNLLKNPEILAALINYNTAAFAAASISGSSQCNFFNNIVPTCQSRDLTTSKHNYEPGWSSSNKLSPVNTLNKSSNGSINVSPSNCLTGQHVIGHFSPIDQFIGMP